MTQLEIDVDSYLQLATFGEDPFAAFVERSTQAGLPQIQVSTVFGRFLELLTRITGATTVLEVGTLGGYSAAWMASALPAGGRITSLEIDPHHAATARENLASVGLADRVEIHVGPALETLVGLRGDATVAGRVELAFIDADKVNNAHYVNHVVELAKPGAVIIVDNVVRDGSVLDAATDDPTIVGTRAVLELLGSHPRLTATALQTVGMKHHDGFAMAIVN
jgi:predicted O-methyltransferase YrrM